MHLYRYLILDDIQLHFDGFEPPVPGPPGLRLGRETAKNRASEVYFEHLQTQVLVADGTPQVVVLRLSRQKRCNVLSRKLASASWSLLALASSGAAPRHHVNIH